MPKKARMFVFLFLTIVVITVSTFAIKSAYKNFLYKLYPIKYEQIVNKASNDYNVLPELIYAVIKTESGFNINSVSSSGAIGLMQITPVTFDWLQSKRSVYNKKSQNYLFDENINIDYGTYFLSYLEQKYENKKSAIAAYNAGVGAVDGWLKNSEYSLDGKILEKIPYKQTENYVKKVIENEKMYKDLYFS